MWILEQVIFHGAMMYAAGTVAAAWAWGRRREIPDALLLILGIGVPTTGWMFALASPWFALLIPASHLFLWRLSNARERTSRDALDAMEREESAAVDARVEAVPDDGAALMALAQRLESEGRWAEALERYEQAHHASELMLSADRMRELRERLEGAMRGDPTIVPQPLEPADVIAYILGAGLMLDSIPRGLAVISSLAFARWLRANSAL